MRFSFNKKKKQPSYDLQVLKKSRVPILTLDKVWHDIFTNNRKNRSIMDLEENLNNLLKEQGKLTNEYKEYTQMKKQFVDQILGLTTEAFDNNNESAKVDMTRYQKYIKESNEKLEQIEKRLQEIPEEIQITNSNLLEETVRCCYTDMKESQAELEQLNADIEELRNALKEKLEKKTVHEENAQKIYAYLHSLVGSDFIDRLDKEYWR